MAVLGPSCHSVNLNLFKPILVLMTLIRKKKRWEKVLFAPIRELFDRCNKNLGNALIPKDYLPLDETLFPTRNQFAFKQYNPEKTTKYGLLLKSLNCARYSYNYIFHVHSGKTTGEPSEYYITGTYNYVTSPGEIYQWIYCIPVFRSHSGCLIRKLGTLQSNRIGIPPATKETKHRENYSNEI